MNSRVRGFSWLKKWDRIHHNQSMQFCIAGAIAFMLVLFGYNLC